MDFMPKTSLDFFFTFRNFGFPFLFLRYQFLITKIYKLNRHTTNI